MSEPKISRKWSCEYCTYENWPATKRCTLCRAPKQPQFITDESPSPSIEQDIYKMAPLISPDGNDGGQSSSQQPTNSLDGSQTTSGKWACQMCTYLNWPKAVKCTQCLTARPKPVAAISRNTTQEELKPLSIKVNIEEVSGAGPGSMSQNNSPRTSPSSPEDAKALNNDRNKAVAAVVLAAKSVKWKCRACTYENWPKSLRCIICGVQRGKSYPEISNTSSKEILTMGGEEDLEIRSLDTNKKTGIGTSICVGTSRSPPNRSPPSVQGSESIQQIGGATASPTINYQEKQDKNREVEKRLRQIRNRLRDTDWLWLNACKGVVDGDTHAMEAYLASGGNPSRQLTVDECTLLNRPSAFQVGYTLVHLGIRFQREDMLAALLTATDVATKAKKRVPSHASPDIAAEILREISASIRQRKGDFPCFFVSENVTFALPADIEDLPRPVQKQLFDELLDRDAQKELEVVEPIINWSVEITERLGSRLYALWNRTAGDCLLDSALQATWGVFDRDNTLRRALGDSLCEGATTFYPRWKETETMQAQSLHFTLDQAQWQQDWSLLLSLASQPGASLEQVHVFALAHILRRPIIVYGIKFVKSFRGENIGLARFQGVYLPLLWEPSFCWKTPIALGYTRGHFSALVPMELDTDENVGAGANIQTNEDMQIAYLPLMDSEGKLLPIHFQSGSELGKEETILREWLDCCVTDGGLLVAQQKITKRPILVRQMVDEWMDRYRRFAHVLQASHKSHKSPSAQLVEISSEGETDDE